MSTRFDSAPVVHRSKLGWAFLLLATFAVALVLVPSPARAEEASVTLMAQGPADLIELLAQDIAKDYSPYLEDGTLFLDIKAGNQCNGGTCLPDGSSVALSCPTSGGPTCSGDTPDCSCICYKDNQGTWQTKSTCVRRPSQS